MAGIDGGDGERQEDAGGGGAAGCAREPRAPRPHGRSATRPPKPADLKAAAMGDAAVQAMLDVFPAEIEDVEEI